jgi:hypothetical protein
MPDELLPKVDLFRISGPMLEVLSDLVRQAVRQEMAEAAPPGAMRAAQAADYIGVGRSRFYKLLKEDPQLLGLSFTVGTARMWPREALDRWMQARQAKTATTPGEVGIGPSADTTRGGIPAVGEEPR